MTKKLLKKLKRDHRHKKLNAIATAIGIQYSTLYRIAMGQTMGSVPTWEKIEAFYMAHEKICFKTECAGCMADKTTEGD